MSKSKFLFGIILCVLAISTIEMSAQENQNKSETLDARQQSLVVISALAATGDLEALKKQLNVGLESGLTINEIKELLVQLYAYCGFPRSLNAINTFISVLEERRSKGITDKPGKDTVRDPLRGPPPENPLAAEAMAFDASETGWHELERPLEMLFRVGGISQFVVAECQP